MSNCETLNLPLIEVEPHQVRELLRCVLHTIIFNRALGHVRPRDVDSELFDITYVHCGDEEVDRRIEAKISEFCQFIERKTGEVAQVGTLAGASRDRGPRPALRPPAHSCMPTPRSRRRPPAADARLLREAPPPGQLVRQAGRPALLGAVVRQRVHPAARRGQLRHQLGAARQR
jgi:hypothetical protein